LGFPSSGSFAEATDGTFMIALSFDGRLLFSRDDGLTWNFTSSILPASTPYSADAT
jgi:hypothetical protein